MGGGEAEPLPARRWSQPDPCRGAEAITWARACAAWGGGGGLCASEAAHSLTGLEVMAEGPD